jgi:hypothetical protein
MARDAAGARIDLNTVTTTVVSRHDLADAIEVFTPDLTGPACWHVPSGLSTRFSEITARAPLGPHSLAVITAR